MNDLSLQIIQATIAKILAKLSPELYNEYKDFQLFDIINDEKLRYIIAIAMSKDNIEASEKILKTTQRTFYRKIVDYKLNPKMIREEVK